MSNNISDLEREEFIEAQEVIKNNGYSITMYQVEIDCLKEMIDKLLTFPDIQDNTRQSLIDIVNEIELFKLKMLP